MTSEFLSVTMTAVARGAVGELNQNGAPPAICPGVQMDCLVIMTVQAGFCTQPSGCDAALPSSRNASR